MGDLSLGFNVSMLYVWTRDKHDTQVLLHFDMSL